MKNKTLNKEEILSRLEKSNPEQLEARLEMKSESSAPPAPKKHIQYYDIDGTPLDSYGHRIMPNGRIDTLGGDMPE